MFKRFLSTTPGVRAQLTPTKVEGRKNTKTVLWKMYAYFHKHNTVCSLVAVEEDLDFMKKNEHLSYNDKVLYYMQLPHQPKLHITAGQLGFRKAQRQEYEAGFQVASKLFRTIEENNMIGPRDNVELIVKDFGKGREAFFAALQGKEGQHIRGNIARVYDSTKLKFGGNRPKKQRRL
ncbi:small ribosomal subunit protein uS11m [Diutina catenulata]